MTKRAPVPNGFLRDPINLLAFGFGSGLMPWAPGTAGTLVGVVIYISLFPLGTGLYIAVTAVMLLAGLWLCDEAAKRLGVHDHSGIVWDEIVGYLIAMTAVPVHWTTLLAGFILFRAFDILKPWPIRRIDVHVRGGLGIMLDDILAGVYTAVVLHLMVAFDIVKV